MFRWIIHILQESLDRLFSWDVSSEYYFFFHSEIVRNILPSRDSRDSQLYSIGDYRHPILFTEEIELSEGIRIWEVDTSPHYPEEWDEWDYCLQYLFAWVRYFDDGAYLISIYYRCTIMSESSTWLDDRGERLARESRESMIGRWLITTSGESDGVLTHIREPESKPCLSGLL